MRKNLPYGFFLCIAYVYLINNDIWDECAGVTTFSGKNVKRSSSQNIGCMLACCSETMASVSSFFHSYFPAS